MPVTKQTYSLNATWTAVNMADMMRTAFIDAGLMTDWHDSFVIGAKNFRVMRIQHNAAKVYGSSFYYFIFEQSSSLIPRVALATGWNPSGTPPVNVPTGAQYLDYHRLPTDLGNNVNTSTALSPSLSTTSNTFLDRYTSAIDAKQTWFVLRQPGVVSQPFSFLHKDTTLHSWLDLDKGVISGLSTVKAGVENRMGYVSFRFEENIRRCLLYGTALRGSTGFDSDWHGVQYNTQTYVGAGSSASGSNFSAIIQKTSLGAAVALPIGKNSANPAYTNDYSPICTNLPWSPWTPTRLADDFGVYMHYPDNDTAYADRFVVQAAINEWEVLNWANNTVVNDGASSSFLARVV